MIHTHYCFVNRLNSIKARQEFELSTFPEASHYTLYSKVIHGVSCVVFVYKGFLKDEQLEMCVLVAKDWFGNGDLLIEDRVTLSIRVPKESKGTLLNA